MPDILLAADSHLMNSEGYDLCCIP